jgi:hypothetical protein
MYISPAAAQAARYAATQAGNGVLGGGGVGLSVTGVRRDTAVPTQGRPTNAASSHGLPTGMNTSHGMGGLNQSSVVLGANSGMGTGHGRVGAGGSYALTYAHGAGYRAGGMTGAGGGRSSLGIPMSLQGSSTGTLRYTATVNAAMGVGAGMGGMARAGQGYGLHNGGLALRGTGAR